MPPASPPPSHRDRLLVGLSNLLFVLSGLFVVVCAAIFVNPALAPEQMRPATASATGTSTSPATSTPTARATATPTKAIAPLLAATALLAPATALAPSLTPSPSLAPTLTPALTATPIPSETATPTTTPTFTPSPTATQSEYLYVLQAGYPKYSAYPGGCGWLGFAGQVFDLGGQPVIDLVIHVGGVDYLTLSGMSQAYGIRGWVQKVAEGPAASQDYYSVRLEDLVGNPLSASVALTTSGSCDQNLVTVNFIQDH